MIPDSYEPCFCASGKKYKFCCKRVQHELIEAMVDYEAGRVTDALKWIEKAKNVVGETAEVLCRESIIYSQIDPEKSQQLQMQCMTVNPNYPRVHYLRGIVFNQAGDYPAAIDAYKKAIECYPKTDHFHLNEAYNNLGCVYYRLGETENAKTAWEKALLYLPEDEMTQRNLNELVYHQPGKSPVIHEFH